MNRIYSVIYSEAKNGYVVVSELARRHGKHTHSRRGKAAIAAAVLTALASVSWAGMPEAQAAERTTPLVVTEKDQTIHDDFGTASQPVSITDGQTPAVLEIASSAADKGGVTTVNSQTIHGSFSNQGEANGIWVQDNYPGTVRLANGLNVKVDAAGNSYNTSGIYLEGVDISRDPDYGSDKQPPYNKPNESRAANNEYTNTYKGQISPTTVHVGDQTTITINGKALEGKVGEYINATALENHFGHMMVGDNVHLIITSDVFQSNDSVGFHQLFYGNTTIGNGFSSSVSVNTDKDSKLVRVGALVSGHDHYGDQAPVATQAVLHIRDNASLQVLAKVDSTPNSQEVSLHGASLSSTDFSFGNRLHVEVDQIGANNNQKTEDVNEHSNVFGIFARRGKGKIGDGLSNILDVKNSSIYGIDGMKVSGWRQTKGKTEDDTDSSIISLGSSSQNKITVENSYAEMIRGISLDSNSHLQMKEQGDVSVQQNGGDSQTLTGISLMDKSKMNVGSQGNVSLVQSGGKTEAMVGVFLDNQSFTEMAQNETISIVQNGGQSNIIYGIYNSNGSTFTAGDRMRAELSLKGDGINNNGIGLCNRIKSSMTVGNNNRVVVSLHNTGTNSFGGTIGIQNALSNAQFGNNLSVQVQAVNYKKAEGIRNSGVDATPATMTIGDNLSVDVKASSLTGDGAPTVEGIRNGTNNHPGYTFTDGKNTMLRVGKNAHISVTAPDKVTDVSALHSFNHANAELGDGAVLTVNSHARNSSGRIINNVVKADDAGHVTFAGGMTLVGSQNAIYSTGDGSSVAAMGAGRKVILGDLKSADKGSIKLNLNTADSLLRGKSIIDGFKPDAATTHGLMAAATEVNDASGNASGDTMPADTELTVANGARWDMTDNSQVTTLNHDNGGTVNMAYNPKLQRLDVGTYSGKGGVFRMKSDLNERETAGHPYADKVYIKDAAAGSKGLIQVHDKSFLTGHEVTGTKYQLLVTDASGKATFSGLTLDDGGLWDVTPTIQNGKYVHDVMGVSDANEKQWYLTKLEKSINKDTKPLLGAADYAYGSYRMDIETLRQRMGELRFLKDKQDESGIWARTYGGEFDGPGYDSRYHALQLGYDYAANPKSFYGWFGERGIASPHYDYGTSSNHSLAAGVYGTWFGDSGVYTDAVAKWGRDDVNLHTSGSYPDKANYRTRAASLSLEYGKTMNLSDQGVFIEPQAQLVYGHLGSTHYTTAREKQVHLDDYDSFIGRVGFVFGRRTPDATKPLDYYLRLSALHEFGGRRAMQLSASDGETMDWSRDYGSTWYEASLGGTYRLSDRTTLYGDVQRTFGSDWHKKWQGNIGINWQF